jgi:hypothetical protein
MVFTSSRSLEIALKVRKNKNVHSAIYVSTIQRLQAVVKKNVGRRLTDVCVLAKLRFATWKSVRLSIVFAEKLRQSKRDKQILHSSHGRSRQTGGMAQKAPLERALFIIGLQPLPKIPLINQSHHNQTPLICTIASRNSSTDPTPWSTESGQNAYTSSANASRSVGNLSNSTWSQSLLHPIILSP